MPFESARAHRRFLKLTPHWVPEVFAWPRPLQSVSLSSGVLTFFHHQLGAAPAYRSGPVFGSWEAEGERLQVVCAAMAGYLPWTEYDPEQPFALQAEYVLGWTDALRAMVSPEIDWVGQWLALPVGVGGHAEETRQVKQAAALQLVDPHRPLLVLQPPGDGPRTHAYVFEEGARLLDVQELM